MAIKSTLQTVSLLFVVAAAAGSKAPKCVEDMAVPLVPYCDLVRNPADYDGQLVRTDAVWQGMIHAGALADRTCGASASEPLLTLPSFSQHSNFNSPQRKELWRILGKGRAARVRIMGTFHGPKGRPYAADGQKFQIEIDCLLSVTPLEPSSK